MRFLRCESRESVSDGIVEVRDGSGRRGPKQSFQLGEDVFDRVEIGTVRRQVKEADTRCLDHLSEALHLVGVQVVHHDD